MNLKNLKSIFEDNGCQKIYIKILAPNDNSKNQVYFGGNFEILNVLPIGEITNEAAGDWNRERFKASLNFNWISDEGKLYHAPQSQLILYPKYPEVRFSGFLAKCTNPPSELMTQRLANRLLFFAVAKTGSVLGYVSSPDSLIAKEFNALSDIKEYGIFKIIELGHAINNKEKLLAELYRIHQLGWIRSKRLDGLKNILPCESPNCGGYTLEAELGITPNGYSEPDFLGWEVKQFGVKNFEKINTATITLMTPEPTNGYYVTNGAEAFIKKYGYMDKKGRNDRMNFGGTHYAEQKHKLTGLTLNLIGFDKEEGKIRNTDGKIALIDPNGNEAASWNFSSMLLHWNKKHNMACYVPSLSQTDNERKYKYGDNVLLGESTDFQLFLSQMAKGNIYYDPGIKMENISIKSKVKRRSQFRIKSKHLTSLYKNSEIIKLPKDL